MTKAKDSASKFFVTVLLVMISLALCYLPVVAVDLWTGYYTLIKKTPSAAPVWLRFTYYLTFFPAFLNSSLNAGIFLYRNEESRAYFKQVYAHLQSMPREATIPLATQAKVQPCD
eukprot:gene17053-18771_t